LTSKNKHVKDDEDGNLSLHLKRYTIFHALFEALKEKEKRYKKR